MMKTRTHARSAPRDSIVVGLRLLRRILREAMRAVTVRAEIDGERSKHLEQLIDDLRLHIERLEHGEAHGPLPDDDHDLVLPVWSVERTRMKAQEEADRVRAASSRDQGSTPAAGTNAKGDRGPVTFRKFGAGALVRSKGAPRSGCQVRALTTARSIPYGDAWALLYLVQGELRRCAFALVESLAANDQRFGVKRTLRFPAVKGEPRMTGAEFCKRHPKGRYILRMSHHVAAVKDGVLYDAFDSSAKCVYTGWEVMPAP